MIACKHVSMYIYSITIDHACSALVITIDKENMGSRPPVEKYIAVWGGLFCYVSSCWMAFSSIWRPFFILAGTHERKHGLHMCIFVEPPSQSEMAEHKFVIIILLCLWNNTGHVYVKIYNEPYDLVNDDS